MNALKREKVAFEQLIEHKGRMVVPEDQDGKADELPEELLPTGPIKDDNTSSRKGGNVVTKHGEVVVIC